MNNDHTSPVEQIFSFARDSILSRAPYIAAELHRIRYCTALGTILPKFVADSILIDEAELTAAFIRDDQAPQRILLHIYAHSLLRHPSLRASGCREAFNLACDLLAARLVRSLIPDLLPSSMIIPLRNLESFFAGYSDPNEIALLIESDPELMRQLSFYSDALRIDDHSEWSSIAAPLSGISTSGCNGAPALIGRRSGTGLTGTEDEARCLDIHLTEGKAFRFARILRKYTQPGEDPRPDPDAFQIPLYLYGLESLDTIIIEENEFREGRMLSSFVIAIDTSGSCSRDLTARFLALTRDILLKENLFFKRFNLHILQCDNRIRRDDTITNAAAFRRYIEQLQVYGGGGTDFRPIFERVHELRITGKLPGLRGILCFSDGLGTFPTNPPDYGVTFAFPSVSQEPRIIPNWIESIYFEE